MSYPKRYAQLIGKQLEPGIEKRIIASPEKLNTNTADARMHRGLAEARRDVDAGDEVAVMRLRGAGRGFSAEKALL